MRCCLAFGDSSESMWRFARCRVRVARFPQMMYAWTSANEGGLHGLARRHLACSPGVAGLAT